MIALILSSGTSQVATCLARVDDTFDILANYGIASSDGQSGLNVPKMPHVDRQVTAGRECASVHIGAARVRRWTVRVISDNSR